jgi:hypothetical protein
VTDDPRPVRVDWATIGGPGDWHAYPRRFGPDVRNFNGETDLSAALCGAGKGAWPWSGMILSPTCPDCLAKTVPLGDGPARIVKENA